MCIALVSQPGPEWREALLSGSLCEFLGEVYRSLPALLAPSAGEGWRDEPLAVQSRQLLVQLCCLTGPALFGGYTSQLQHSTLSNFSVWLYFPGVG